MIRDLFWRDGIRNPEATRATLSHDRRRGGRVPVHWNVVPVPMLGPELGPGCLGTGGTRRTALPGKFGVCYA